MIRGSPPICYIDFESYRSSSITNRTGPMENWTDIWTYQCRIEFIKTVDEKNWRALTVGPVCSEPQSRLIECAGEESVLKHSRPF